MMLRFNRKDELEIVGIGVFAPGEIVIADEARAKKYIDSGYFDLMKEKKSKVRKSKKKGVDRL